jgi:hypothetical protein
MASGTTEVPRLTPPSLSPLTRRERRQVAKSRATGAAPWLVAAATLVLRLVTAATGPTDWDSAQYAAAVGHYDVTHGQPQPPGYWLYVEAGRIFHQVTGVGTIHSLVVVAAVASAAAAGLTVVAGSDLGGRWLGLAAGVIVATCPFAWFSGSIVATYSFDLVACPLFIILAWRARPGSFHGVVAILMLGVLSGFRQSIVQSFALLALIPLVASVRHLRQLALVIGAAGVGFGVWLVPLSLAQPGGLRTWVRATHIETSGAAQATSIFVHGAAGATNVGTFFAYTVVALAPLAVLTALAGVVIGVGSLVGRPVGARQWSSWTDGGPSRGVGAERRPWYQLRVTVLAAAILPPVLLVALVQFAKGGYLLAYLPAAVIALLLPLAYLNGTSSPARHTSRPWLVVFTVAVAAVAVLGAQRFVSGNGVLPGGLVNPASAVWLEQPRYQAPYADTRQTITAADQMDAAMTGLAPFIRNSGDVVVFDTLDGGQNIYRNAGWSLPDVRSALIEPDQLLYNQLHGALYYASGSSILVGRPGSVYLVASPALPGLSTLASHHQASLVPLSPTIGGYRVFKLPAGASVLGLRVVARSGPRPLGRGI